VSRARASFRRVIFTRTREHSTDGVRRANQHPSGVTPRTRTALNPTQPWTPMPPSTWMIRRCPWATRRGGRPAAAIASPDPAAAAAAAHAVGARKRARRPRVRPVRRTCASRACSKCLPVPKHALRVTPPPQPQPQPQPRHPPPRLLLRRRLQHTAATRDLHPHPHLPLLLLLPRVRLPRQTWALGRKAACSAPLPRSFVPRRQRQRMTPWPGVLGFRLMTSRKTTTTFRTTPLQARLRNSHLPPLTWWQGSLPHPLLLQHLLRHPPLLHHPPLLRHQSLPLPLRSLHHRLLLTSRLPSVPLPPPHQRQRRQQPQLQPRRRTTARRMAKKVTAARPQRTGSWRRDLRSTSHGQGVVVPLVLATMAQAVVEMEVVGRAPVRGRVMQTAKRRSTVQPRMTALWTTRVTSFATTSVAARGTFPPCRCGCARLSASTAPHHHPPPPPPPPPRRGVAGGRRRRRKLRWT